MMRAVPDRNPAGEHSFTSRGVFLSMHLGDNLPLEQRTTDGRWSGRSMRGDVKVMMPGEDRIFIHSRPARFAHLTIDPALLGTSGISPAALRPHTIVRDQALRHLIEALMSEDTSGPESLLFEEAVARAIAVRLATLNGSLPRPPTRALPPAKLRRVLERIDDELAQNLSIADLASVADLSPSHFAALFKASVGEPPHAHQLRRRVERARDLIVRGYTAADAAAQVGFFDQSHLSRHMRRILGTSPLAIRRAARSGG
jgi:AraC family transcriptional regulator